MPSVNSASSLRQRASCSFSSCFSRSLSILTIFQIGGPFQWAIITATTPNANMQTATKDQKVIAICLGMTI